MDITKEPMEIGPTCHYVMGGVEVDPDTAASSVPGLFAAGEVSGGMHGSNRLGGNSLSDLLVFGKRAGDGAADYLDSLESSPPSVSEAALADAVDEALAPFSRAAGENPYTVHSELQQTMNDLVGLIRREHEVRQALEELVKFKERAATVAVPGGRAYNPGWHYALDLRNMLLVAECVAMAALERQESRGGHTREDYPEMSPRVAQGEPDPDAVRRPGGDDPPADAGDPARAARAIRGVRAEEVHDGGGADRAGYGYACSAVG